MWFKQILILATLEIFLVVKKLLFGIGVFVGKGFKNPAKYSLYCFLTHVLPKLAKTNISKKCNLKPGKN